MSQDDRFAQLLAAFEEQMLAFQSLRRQVQKAEAEKTALMLTIFALADTFATRLELPDDALTSSIDAMVARGKRASYPPDVLDALRRVQQRFSLLRPTP